MQYTILYNTTHFKPFKDMTAGNLKQIHAMKFFFNFHLGSHV